MTDLLIPTPSAGSHPQTENPGRRRRLSPKRHLRFAVVTLRDEITLVASALVAYATFVSITMSTATQIYLPPDGAHYLGEADTILGRGVLDFIHPPAFALLVAFCRAVTRSELGGIFVAVVAAMTLTFFALYLLLRQWMAPTPALVGTSVGMLMPIMGELVGWAAGPTILGIAFGLLALAAFEHWCSGNRRTGVLVGTALALTMFAHPFALLVTCACLGVRWLVELQHRGSLTRDRSPSGMFGVASVLLSVMLAGLLTLSYYGQVDSPTALSIGLPAVGTLDRVLRWAARDNRLLLVLSAAGFAAAFLATSRRARAVTGPLAAIVIAVPIFVRADGSYLSRVAYYTPVLVAVAVGFGWTRLAAPVATRVRTSHPRELVLALAIVLVTFVALTGFGPRAHSAIRYYGRLDKGDVHLLQGLRHGTGTIATSWSRNDYASGDSYSWYVSGLAKRRAIGPAGPWLVTRASERITGRELQQFFAGTTGIENAALQLASQSTTSPSRLAIQASVPGLQRGFFFPFLALNPGGLRYPEEIQGAEHFPLPVGTPKVANTADGITLIYPGPDATPAVIGTLTLTGDEVKASFRALRPVRGPWRITFRPDSGAGWVERYASGTSIGLVQPVADHPVISDIRADTPGAQIGLVSLGSSGSTELAISTSETSGVDFSVRVSGSGVPGATTRFNHREIIAARHLSDVVIFKDSGLGQLFATDPCFRTEDESSQLVAFRIDPTCQPSG